MQYVLCSFVSVFSFIIIRYSQKDKYKPLQLKTNLGINILPFVYCILILGLQNNVGSDYPTYYRYFEYGSNYDLDIYLRKKEYAFYWIAKLIGESFLPGQTGFFVFAIIQGIFLYLFLKDFEFIRFEYFYFIFFICSTAFVNQTNLIRQYTAMYIFLFATKFLYERKLWRYVVTILFASLFHISAMVLLFIYPFNFYIRKFNKKYIFWELIISIFLFRYSPEFLLSKIINNPYYSSYFAATDTSIIFLLTKIIFIPFYLRILFAKIRFDDKEKYFLHIGFICYCYKLVSTSSFIMMRFAVYFDVLCYLPLYYYLYYLCKNVKGREKYKYVTELFIFLMLTIGPYLIKTLIYPSGEYLYKSILFVN